MKTLIRVIAIALLLVFGALLAKAQDRPLHNGFHARLNSSFVKNDINFYGLDLGNTWYVAHFDEYNLAIGITTSWVDVGMALQNEPTYERTYLNIGFTQFGGVASYALAPEMAVDLHFKIKPTLIIDEIDYNDDLAIIGNYSVSTVGFGTAQCIGAAFRYQKLQLGMEFGFGNINAIQTADYEYSESYELSTSYPAKYTRFFVGFRF